MGAGTVGAPGGGGGNVGTGVCVLLLLPGGLQLLWDLGVCCCCDLGALDGSERSGFHWDASLHHSHYIL